MVNSMTGFASVTGQDESASWAWEIRSVNSKGFDLRQRLPDGCDALEKAAKNMIAKTFTRGTIFLSLKVNLAARSGQITVDDAVLSASLNAIKSIENKAKELDVSVRAPSLAEILSISGVAQSDTADQSQDWMVSAKDQLPDLIDQFANARADEGGALRTILTSQTEAVSELITQATSAAAARASLVNDKLRASILDIVTDHDALDPHRLEQEVALIMVKNDVSEEVDRLRAHVDAARSLLEQKVPIGRKFDFLMQEFNREANTLCSKSNSTDLTRIGVDLKTIIDQMREQVQNVE